MIASSSKKALGLLLVGLGLSLSGAVDTVETSNKNNLRGSDKNADAKSEGDEASRLLTTNGWIPTPVPPTGPILGGDVDAYGCRASAGYSWCAPLGECTRANECTSTAPARPGGWTGGWTGGWSGGMGGGMGGGRPGMGGGRPGMGGGRPGMGGGRPGMGGNGGVWSCRGPGCPGGWSSDSGSEDYYWTPGYWSGSDSEDYWGGPGWSSDSEDYYWGGPGYWSGSEDYWGGNRRPGWWSGSDDWYSADSEDYYYNSWGSPGGWSGNGGWNGNGGWSGNGGWNGHGGNAKGSGWFPGWSWWGGW